MQTASDHMLRPLIYSRGIAHRCQVKGGSHKNGSWFKARKCQVRRHFLVTTIIPWPPVLRMTRTRYRERRRVCGNERVKEMSVSLLQE